MTDTRTADRTYFGMMALALAVLPVLSVIQVQMFAVLRHLGAEPPMLLESLVRGVIGCGYYLIPILIVLRVDRTPLRVLVSVLSGVMLLNHLLGSFGLPNLFTPIFAKDFIYFQF